MWRRRRWPGRRRLAVAAALGLALAACAAAAQPLEPPPAETATWLFRGVFSLLVAVVVPVYYVKHGPSNFLWFSDIGLFGICAALWLEEPLLGSMMALAVLLPETVWLVSVLSGAVAKGRGIGTLASYMYDARIPLYLRVLSGAFHLALPPGALWLVYRYGYDARALPAQTLLAWLVLAATLRLTPPEKNVNWVRGFGHPPRSIVPPRWHFPLMLLVFPLVIYLPTHWLLERLFGS